MIVNKSKVRIAYFIIAFLTLLCGVAIYPLFRDPNLLIWDILPKPGFWEMWRIPYPKEGIASVLIGSGPDFLWLLSGICIIRVVWYNDRKMQMVYLVFMYLIAAGYNIGQYFHLIPGTFDLFDLLSMSGVALAEGIIFRFLLRREEK